MGLTTIQVKVLEIINGVDGRGEFVLVGGAALIARNLVNRTTLDIDLFTRKAELANVFSDACEQALSAAGYLVTRQTDKPGFVQLVVSLDGTETNIDFGSDYYVQVEESEYGPTLSDDELGANKVLALFSRAEQRDAFDLWSICKHTPLANLVEIACRKDPGFDTKHFVEALNAVSRFSPEEIDFDPTTWSAILEWIVHVQSDGFSDQ